MNMHVRGAAKRLIFSLIVASTLAGCAVYQLGYPGYAVDPYPYGTPFYSGVPYYVGPPVSLGLWYGARGGGHRGHRGHHGHRDHGHHGHHGEWGGRHR